MEEEAIFHQEDENSVTDDTLEFLSLDDDMIEEYNRTHSTARNNDEYEDEDYEDEDDEYEDEDYEEDDEEDGFIVRFKNYLSDVSTIDMVVAILGIVVLAGVLVTGGLYATAKMTEAQVEAFASVGQEIEGISVIGEGGLIAVSESARLADMMSVEEEEEQEEEQEDEKEDIIEVSLHLTSIQSDIKIKFVNKETGKLIGSVPFEVEVTNGKKTFSLKDEDKDGIIYQTGIDAGSYQVTIKPLTGTEYEKKYKLPTQASSVEVTDTIAYKKVDVADEVKTEAEVNVAAEDTAQQNTVVESTLQDTVEWVESTKTPVCLLYTSPSPRD